MPVFRAKGFHLFLRIDYEKGLYFYILSGLYNNKVWKLLLVNRPISVSTRL